MTIRRALSCVVVLAVAGCSWFQSTEPKQRVVVRTTPRVPNFPTEAEAKIGCQNDLVVWGDSTALIYYPEGSALYAKTKPWRLPLQADGGTWRLSRSRRHGKVIKVSRFPSKRRHCEP